MVTALVRRPGPRLEEGLVTHVRPQPIDLARARRQWEGYVAALASFGWEIREVAPADDHPDAVFVEDTAVVFHDVAVLARPGADARRGEVAASAATLADLGLATLGLPPGATLDGGDVLKVDRDVWVGVGGRTNATGLAALQDLLTPRGWSVRGVATTLVLHLKSAVTALPDGTIIGHRPLVDDPSSFPDFLAVPEEGGAHVVVLDDRTVLMATSAPRSAAQLRARGLDVVTVDLSEYEKLEGCVTCLSIRLRH